MKKYLVYSLLCVALASVLMFYSNKETPEVDAPSVTEVAIVEEPVIEYEEPLDISPIKTLMSSVDTADDVSMQYTYWLTVDGIENEIYNQYTLHNYEDKTGHVVVIDGCENRDLWYGEDYMYTCTDETDWHYANASSDLVDCEEVTTYVRKNINTVKFITDFISTSVDTTVKDYGEFTLYKSKTCNAVALGELLRSDTTADMKYATFYLKLPEDPYTAILAKLVIDYTGSDLGIERETYEYHFNVNTGYSTTIPVDIGGCDAL